MPYFIASPCIDVMDRSCIEECPVDCIYEGDRKLYINPGECIDCGACEPACPEGAIFTDFKAPPEMARFVEDNRRFFAESRSVSISLRRLMTMFLRSRSILMISARTLRPM